jgi:hypothetical protein
MKHLLKTARSNYHHGEQKANIISAFVSPYPFSHTGKHPSSAQA